MKAIATRSTCSASGLGLAIVNDDRGEMKVGQRRSLAHGGRFATRPPSPADAHFQRRERPLGRSDADHEHRSAHRARHSATAVVLRRRPAFADRRDHPVDGRCAPPQKTKVDAGLFVRGRPGAWPSCRTAAGVLWWVG